MYLTFSAPIALFDRAAGGRKKKESYQVAATKSNRGRLFCHQLHHLFSPTDFPSEPATHALRHPGTVKLGVFTLPNISLPNQPTGTSPRTINQSSLTSFSFCLSLADLSTATLELPCNLNPTIAAPPHCTRPRLWAHLCDTRPAKGCKPSKHQPWRPLRSRPTRPPIT